MVFFRDFHFFGSGIYTLWCSFGMWWMIFSASFPGFQTGGFKKLKRSYHWKIPKKKQKKVFPEIKYFLIRKGIHSWSLPWHSATSAPGYNGSTAKPTLGGATSNRLRPLTIFHQQGVRKTSVDSVKSQVPSPSFWKDWNSVTSLGIEK